MREGRREMSGWSSIVFIGVLLALIGPGTVATIIVENWKTPLAEWEWWEPAVVVLFGVGFLVGICFIIFGCGGRLPQPTDPVTVEVVACEPTLGTEGQYLKLENWRRTVGVCEAAMADDEVARRVIRNTAERDVDRLGQEFDIYHVQGRTDCYCGPVCQEMTEFIEEARRNGLFCRGP